MIDRRLRVPPPRPRRFWGLTGGDFVWIATGAPAFLIGWLLAYLNCGC